VHHRMQLLLLLRLDPTSGCLAVWI
jgi:hypothetical protein